jgi:hypothetical protein
MDLASTSFHTRNNVITDWHRDTPSSLRVTRTVCGKRYHDFSPGRQKKTSDKLINSRYFPVICDLWPEQLQLTKSDVTSPLCEIHLHISDQCIARNTLINAISHDPVTEYSHESRYRWMSTYIEIGYAMLGSFTLFRSFRIEITLWSISWYRRNKRQEQGF